MPTELRKVMANVTSLDSFLRALKAERMTTLVEAVRIHNRGEKDRRREGIGSFIIIIFI